MSRLVLLFNVLAPTELYTLSLHAALAIFVYTPIELFESFESFGRQSVFRFFQLHRLARILNHNPDYVFFSQLMKEAVIK